MFSESFALAFSFVALTDLSLSLRGGRWLYQEIGNGLGIFRLFFSCSNSQAGESMPLFAGYEQHDVQEFLAFLLDAVHEDLNRVSNAERKYVEAKEAKEGEAEELVARDAWKGYLEVGAAVFSVTKLLTSFSRLLPVD